MYSPICKVLPVVHMSISSVLHFKEGGLLAVNLGNDADTTGAIYGQIAGAYYGVSGIPASWCERLAHLDLINRFALGLYKNAT